MPSRSENLSFLVNGRSDK